LLGYVITKKIKNKMGQKKGNGNNIPTPQQQAYIDKYGSGAVRTNNGTVPVMIASNTTLNAVVDATFATDVDKVATNAKLDALSPFAAITGSCANDTAAASAGVPVGGLYHTSGTIKVRLV
jgi:hypothetical protein